MRWQLRLLDVPASPRRAGGWYWTLITPDEEHFAYWLPTCEGWSRGWEMIDYLREHRGLT